MKKKLSIVAWPLMTVGLLLSCGQKNEYNLKGDFGTDYDNMPVLLISLSNGDTISADTVRNGLFEFSGIVENPELVQIRIGGRAVASAILEPGQVNVTPNSISGTPLNDELQSYANKWQEISTKIKENINDSTKEEQLEILTQQLSQQFSEFGDSLMQANLDNPIGASLMIDKAYEMSGTELEKTMDQHPSLKSYAKLNKILDQKKVAEATGEGKPYKDFEISYNGTTTKLSDLIKPDHYTLVDFWASWCGPCRREIPVIKEIREEWGPKGLDVVGVAVWDEPQNSEKAMEDLGIDWPVIINAQTVPTDLYGILGIPCIILIGPDGTILSRDRLGDELKAAVANAMSQK